MIQDFGLGAVGQYPISGLPSQPISNIQYPLLFFSYFSFASQELAAAIVVGCPVRARLDGGLPAGGAWVLAMIDRTNSPIDASGLRGIQFNSACRAPSMIVRASGSVAQGSREILVHSLPPALPNALFPPPRAPQYPISAAPQPLISEIRKSEIRGRSTDGATRQASAPQRG